MHSLVFLDPYKRAVCPSFVHNYSLYIYVYIYTFHGYCCSDCTASWNASYPQKLVPHVEYVCRILDDNRRCYSYEWKCAPRFIFVRDMQENYIYQSCVTSGDKRDQDASESMNLRPGGGTKAGRTLLILYQRLFSCKSKLMTMMVGTNDYDGDGDGDGDGDDGGDNGNDDDNDEDDDDDDEEDDDDYDDDDNNAKG